MEIILYVMVFTVVSLGLLIYANTQLSEETVYELSFIKGTTRGFMGRIVSVSSLERKREKLGRKNAKF